MMISTAQAHIAARSQIARFRRDFIGRFIMVGGSVGEAVRRESRGGTR